MNRIKGVRGYAMEWFSRLSRAREWIKDHRGRQLRVFNSVILSHFVHALMIGPTESLQFRKVVLQGHLRALFPSLECPLAYPDTYLHAI